MLQQRIWICAEDKYDKEKQKFMTITTIVMSEIMQSEKSATICITRRK